MFAFPVKYQDKTKDHTSKVGKVGDTATSACNSSEELDTGKD
jgi:hypothetical protein